MLPKYAVRADLAVELLREIPTLKILSTQHILIVVDGGIQLAPASGAFGIGKIARIVDGADFGLARTRVTLATRDGAPAKLTLSEAERLTRATYTGFRFDQTEPGGSGRTIERFDQIWCFGIKPLIHNPRPEDDAEIDSPSNNPTLAAETAALREWMDTRMGGVLAMGDHSILGASMCRGIPRVRRMRKWSVADGVPSREFATRHDTNRPATLAQTHDPITNPAPAQIPNDNERDDNPQRIEWVPEYSYRRGFFSYTQPHPVLCHPTLGPIDVFPDHPHEGCCFDTGEVTDPFDDFPTVGGQRPMPRTIAYAHTLADPPTNLQKGDQPARRFPLISVYDGQQIGFGRAMVDSTWHHWFDMNISGLEVENGAEWSKIRRYFINTAIWLAKPAWRSRMLELHLAMVPFTYEYYQEFDLHMDVRRLGVAVIDYLKPLLGACWVRELAIDILHNLPQLVAPLRERLKPIPDPCLSCPPFAMIEEHIYGELGRVALKRAQRTNEKIASKSQLGAKDLELDSLHEEIVGAAKVGVLEMSKRYRDSLKHTEELLRKIDRAVKETN